MCGPSAQTRTFLPRMSSSLICSQTNPSHPIQRVITSIITESDTAPTTASTTSSVLTSSTAIPAVSQNTSSATAISPVPVTSGLSPDEKIGIGVGISIPVSLAIGALLGWFLYRRRATRTHASDPGTGLAGDYASNSSMKTPSHMGIVYMPEGEGDMQYLESKYGHGSHLSPARNGSYRRQQLSPQLSGRNHENVPARHGSYRIQELSPQLSGHNHENAPAQHESYSSQPISPQLSSHNQMHTPAQLDSEAMTGSESQAYEML